MADMGPISATLVIKPAGAEDAEMLAQLRVAAMRPSLEALGRFDPARARARFLNSFCPQNTFKLIAAAPAETLLGFYVLRDEGDGLLLDHLYVAAEGQGRGVGAFAIEHIKAIARAGNLPLRLCALKASPANGFYLHHGFNPCGESEFDLHYVLAPQG